MARTQAKKRKPRLTWATDPTQDPAYPFQGATTATIPASVAPSQPKTKRVSWGQIKATYRGPGQEQDDR